MRPSKRRTPSSRSAASTRRTPGRWWLPAPSGSAWCGRSAMRRTRPPLPKRCGAPSGWRRVAEAPRKRKQRGGNPMERGYAKAEQRNREAREALVPLAKGERPAVVTVGAMVAALIALSIVAGYLAGVQVEGDKPRLAQVAAPALILGIMAWGMWRARYWAVLGFQLILVFLIFSAVFGLAVQAATVAQFAATFGLLAVAGTFFFFMVKAMARIQMPPRVPRA